MNRFGGSKKQVQDAVGVLEASGDPMRVLRDIQRRAGASEADTRAKRPSHRFARGNTLQVEKIPGALHTLSPELRLALEMAVHEEAERRALDGELSALEAAWREAEEIASIADNLFVLPSVEARFQALRAQGIATDPVPG